MKELQKIQNSLTETIEGRQRISMKMEEMIVQIRDHTKEMKERCRKHAEKMKEVAKSIKLDDQMDTERSENTVMYVEDKVQSTAMSQAEQHSPKLEEKENRIPYSKKEESGQLKGHDDIIMSKEIARVERNVDETMTQVINKPQEIDASITEGNKYLDEKLREQNSQLDNKNLDGGQNKDSMQVVESSMDLVVKEGAINSEENIDVNPEINSSVRYKKLWGLQKLVSKSNYLLFSKMPLLKFRSGMNENLVDYSKEVENFFKMKTAPETSKMMRIKKSVVGDQDNWYGRYMKRPKVIYAKLGQILFGKQEQDS